jgi:hypothetical protein
MIKENKDIVICVNNKDLHECLTLNKAYVVIGYKIVSISNDNTDYMIRIADDNNNKAYFDSNRFLKI